MWVQTRPFHSRVLKQRKPSWNFGREDTPRRFTTCGLLSVHHPCTEIFASKVSFLNLKSVFYLLLTSRKPTLSKLLLRVHGRSPRCLQCSWHCFVRGQS